MQDVVIVAARRTAVGSFGGSLAGIPASDLGALVIKDIMASTGVAPAQIDEVLLGQVLTAGVGQKYGIGYDLKVKARWMDKIVACVSE